MNDYVISAVPVTLVDVVWPQCIKHVQRVVDRAHGDITLESVKAKLMSGNALLITISKGSEIIAVNTMEVRTMDSGEKIMFIPITGGEGLNEWMPRFLDVAKAIAKDYGCSKLRGMSVRPAWERVLKPHGWKNVHMIIECNIEG